MRSPFRGLVPSGEIGKGEMSPILNAVLCFLTYHSPNTPTEAIWLWYFCSGKPWIWGAFEQNAVVKLPMICSVIKSSILHSGCQGSALTCPVLSGRESWKGLESKPPQPAPISPSETGRDFPLKSLIYLKTGSTKQLTLIPPWGSTDGERANPISARRTKGWPHPKQTLSQPSSVLWSIQLAERIRNHESLCPLPSPEKSSASPFPSHSQEGV